MRRSVVLTVIVCFLFGSLSCSSWSRKKRGAVIGAGAGAAVGGVIGKQTDHTVVGAILGAAIGGAAGAWIGSYMDKQAAEIERDIQGAKIERYPEGIKITFDSGLMFDVDKATLRSRTRDELSELAVILNKYPDTEVLLEGHTDATGSDEYNLELSRRRAQAVANHLASANVNATRFTVMGYGEGQPVANNDSVDGRQLNRRVDVAIYANDKLKKAAKAQSGG
ncbi:MAG: OmpA family protein [Candidatus Krumholzibacteria bacterium]|nr:OmpA family protein [Candidatus Krumholzibacteria bacterium]